MITLSLFRSSKILSYLSKIILRMRFNFILPALTLVFITASCDKNKTDFSEDEQVTGTGNYAYSKYEPLESKPVECYYHIPETATESSPVFVVLHGANRDADNMRDYLIDQANDKNFIVLAPEFSEIFLPWQ